MTLTENNYICFVDHHQYDIVKKVVYPMSFSYTINEDEKTARVVATGTVTLESCIEIMKRLADDPEFKPDYHIFVDLRTMDYLPSNDEIEEIIATLSTLKEVYKSRIALLVEGKIQMFIAKLACLLSKRSGFEIEPFTVLEEAEAYLKLED